MRGCRQILELADWRKKPKFVDDNVITDALPTNGASKEPDIDDSMSKSTAKTSVNPPATGNVFRPG